MRQTMQNPKKTGQSLAELGIIIALLVIITVGAIEFGYDFFLLHMITQATSAGSRAASVLGVGNRSICGCILDATSVDTYVRSQIANVATVTSVSVQQIDPACANTLPCPTLTSIPKVSVTVTGSFPSIFGLLGSRTVNFTRTGTFRDEGR
jgi:hypothetical protein